MKNKSDIRCFLKTISMAKEKSPSLRDLPFKEKIGITRTALSNYNLYGSTLSQDLLKEEKKRR